ncbi:phosphotransferase family protein [Dictyobacter kobayashii]|uniref:Acyl-CoA dehydrogenase n=1 Tax=Dictyobacter kobayashii TaxID=2014872 RepID=A0A402AXS8_9CHLR|nr:phosphotransferase family protein [Dictyobacter kobayashii]GCE23873.1 acyl-CoA dehydrogenase [Dictyobacter kobayashii]
MSSDLERRLVDSVALQAYLAQALPLADATMPLVIERVRGGHSNETFFITSGTQEFVLRRPPYGPLLPTAHDVGREYRVLSALADTTVPVPRPLLYCDDIQVIGAPFYLMERIPGIAIRDRLPAAFASNIQARAGIGEALIDALAELHLVDWQAVGLEGFGKPYGYLARQLRRWTGQLDASRTRDIPDLDEVTLWLQEHLPESLHATIVHGDYRLDNALLVPEPPARVLAIVDWEMATLGDPLADVGYLLSFWREAGDPPFTLGDASWEITGQPGFSTRAELVQRYMERTQRKVEHIDFYVALAIWKLAILLEGSYKRYLSGTTDDPFFPVLERGVPALAARALSVCNGEMKFL